MRIDSHQHFWIYTDEEYGWIDDSISMLRRDFLPSDLSPHLAGNSLDGTVAVQARQTDEETQFLLDLAQLESGDIIKGVVGWVDLQSNDLPSRLTGFGSNPLLKGFRHILQGEPEGYMLKPRFIEGVRTLGELGFTYDLLIYSRQLHEAIEFVKSLPNSRIVLDHGAKPKIRNLEWSPWAESLEEIARFSNIFCKVSGLSFESEWTTWSDKTLGPYIRHLLNCFGAERLMFGSDWPVCLPSGSYGTVAQAIEACLSSTEIDRVMGNTAVEFYGLQ